MLLSHRNRFIFLKTRKTAGTSVEMALQPYCAPELEGAVEEAVSATVSEQGIIGTRKIPRKKLTGLNAEWFNHMSASEVAEKVGRETFFAYPRITTVRNPFDQLVSRCHWQMHQGRGSYSNFDELKAYFRDLILNRNWPDDREIVFLDGEFIIDHVVRFEHLRDDLGSLSDILNLDTRYMHLPHTKDTGAARRGQAVADYFDQDTIEEVRRRMAWVFERFNYPDTPDTRPRQ